MLGVIMSHGDYLPVSLGDAAVEGPSAKIPEFKDMNVLLPIPLANGTTRKAVLDSGAHLTQLMSLEEERNMLTGFWTEHSCERIESLRLRPNKSSY